MRQLICLLLIFMMMPFSSLIAQETQTQETSESEEKKPVVEQDLEEFISPPYTCMFCKTYGLTMMHDAKHVLIFPTYYDGKKWLMFGGALGSVLIVSAFDEDIQREIQSRRNRITDKAASIIQPFGFEAAYIIMAGFYLQGVFFHNEKSKIVALDAISSTLITWGMLSSVVKYSTGRSRPFLREGAYHFEPFEGGDHNAFPSGHTTQAFTLASVLSTHYPRKAVIIPAYALASLVGIARMNDDKHWASDVVGGAILGSLVGHELVVYNRRKRGELATKAELESKPKLTIVPLADERGKSINLFIQF